MIDRIYDLKKRLLDYTDKTLEKYGPDRMDVTEIGKIADAIKDLSQAEKECMESEYYQSVTDAMDRSGYMPDGMHDGQYRSGYNPNRDSMGRYSRRRGYRYGYDHDPIQGVREAMTSAAPEDREKMQRELRQMLGM